MFPKRPILPQELQSLAAKTSSAESVPEQNPAQSTTSNPSEDGRKLTQDMSLKNPTRQPLTEADVRAELGIDQDDPNVQVHLIPATEGHNFVQMMDQVFGKYTGNIPETPSTSVQVSDITFEVYQEVLRAVEKHTEPFHGPHEAYAVLLEEVDELWDEVKADRGQQLSGRKEAIQVAAMAVRYILDLDPK